MIVPNIKTIRGGFMTDFPNEIWISVPGYPGYSVSNLGRAKSDGRIITRPNQPSYILREKILKTDSNCRKGGYGVFQGSINGKHFSMDLHVAIALAFFGPRPEGMEVRHLDGNPKNNAISNLKYGTRSENIGDAKKHGTFPMYEKRPGAKITRSDAISIALDVRKTSVIAKQYGINPGTVRQIKIGETWTAITENARSVNKWVYRNRNFSNEDLYFICDIRYPKRFISREIGVARSTINRIRRLYLYKI